MTPRQPQVVFGIYGAENDPIAMHRAWESDAPAKLVELLPTLTRGQHIAVWYEFAQVLASPTASS